MRYFLPSTSFGPLIWRHSQCSAATQAAVFLLTYFFYVVPLLAQENPTGLTHVNGSLFFAASTPDKGTELWKSNGTTSGTVLVKDIASMAASSSPANLKKIGSSLYFTANGIQLWKSNGTAESTVLVKSFTSSIPSPFSQLTEVNGLLYFVLNKGSNTYELWKSDGTSGGTILLKSINSGAAKGFSGLANLNGVLYFSGYDPATGWELWKSNGTAAGTQLVKDIYPGTGSSSPSSLYAWNGSLYFAASTPDKGTELWKSDGTAAGTVLLKDIAPEQEGRYGGSFEVSSFPDTFVAFNGALYFLAQTDYDRYDVGNDRQLWKTDGTTAGTVFIKSIGLPVEFEMLVINETLFFVAQAAQADEFGTKMRSQQLWKSDGTGAGTVILKEFYQEYYYDFFPSFELTNLNGTLLFTLPGGEINNGELWKSNGTSQGTVQVKEIYPEGGGIPNSSTPQDLTVVNNTLYFSAYDGFGVSRQLWKSDGTEAGTVKVIPQSSTLPAPWKNQDIGAVALPGTTRPMSGIEGFLVESGGNDYYKAPDAFHYVYQPFSGNGSITAEVESMGNTHPYALAGLMIREDLSPSSSFVAVAVNPSSSTNFMWRQGSGTPGYKSVTGTTPSLLKLKLERSGNTFTSYYSFDAVNWIMIGQTTITMGSSVYVGLALTSQNNTQLNTATFRFVSVTDTPSTSACTASGSILREYWTNNAGKEITAIPVNTAPASTSQLSSFEAPTNIADNYGQRIRGYICAPTTGNYTFYIASDDNSELWLSTSDNSASKRKIASVTGWARNGDWVKYPSQKSATIALEKGKKYYIEALHKEATGGDNLAVAWASPGSGSISIIPGSVLSPVMPTVIACSATGSILREYWANVRGGAVTDIPFTTTPTSSTQISSFETPSGIGDNYGQRIRGYICAPATGSYIFYIAADDQAELWLSTSDSPASKQKIAYLTAHTSARQWIKYSSQKSVAVSLEKGKKYYIEALHKEAVYGDNLAVGWTIPGSSNISVIPGSVLSPFVPSAAKLAGVELPASPVVVYPNPFSEKLTIATGGQEGKLIITLTDIVGKTYFVTEYVISNQPEVELVLTGLSLKAGLHLLKLQTEDGEIKVIKVVKK
ncbi:PA14 domain-containing protein [Rhodocytophaga aerolata]|uniref:PA14 domain-containing protein n=1 Tax=Rhodocytophaga aerolata TaxID=455078 RepID=A0ABT8RHW5_9BACT|nr:ELWxxDGT repeat protein [Rhodocytophaga aerolata]MDO1451696.1 PA14 domain-containing protein [Rhodocytophaga aerolata]